MVDTTLIILGGSALTIQLILLFFAVKDWLKQPETMPNRYAWLIIAIIVNIIGPIIYFVAAPRTEASEEVPTTDTGWVDY